MKCVVRNIFAVIAGLMVGGAVNTALVMAGGRFVPPPAGVNVNDAKSLAAGIHLLEPRHFVFPFLAHAVGTFVGALLTNVIAARSRSRLAAVIGALFLLGGISACMMIPAPKWFMALDLLAAYGPMTWLGVRLGFALRPDPRSQTPTTPAPQPRPMSVK